MTNPETTPAPETTITEITKTKKIKYLVNGEKEIRIVEVPLTDEERIEARINALRLLVATWQATAQDREDLSLLTW